MYIMRSYYKNRKLLSFYLLELKKEHLTDFALLFFIEMV